MDSKKQNHKVTIFAILLSLISIGVLVFGFTVLSSDKVVMLQSISNIHNKLTTNFDDDTGILDDIAINDNIGIKASTTIKSEKGNYVVKTDYNENAKDKRSYLNITSTLNQEEILNGKFLLNNSKLYANVLGITENYYYDKFDYIHIFRSLSNSDFDKVLSLLKNAINSSISNGDIKKEKVVIKYNGKDKKVNKLTYKINKKELKQIITEFTKSLKEDKELTKNISKALDINEKDLKLKLANFMNDIKNKGDKEIYSYSTYYYGFNKIVAYELYDRENNYLISYKEEKDKDTVNITNGDNQILNYTKNTKKNTFEGKLDLSKVDLKTDKFDNYKKIYEFTGSYKDGNLKLTINKNMDIKFKTISDNGVYKYDLTIKKYNDEKVEILNLKSNIEVYFGNKIKLDDFEIDESKKYSELTEEEYKSFIDRLNNNEIYNLYGKDLLKEYLEK